MRIPTPRARLKHTCRDGMWKYRPLAHENTDPSRTKASKYRPLAHTIPTSHARSCLEMPANEWILLADVAFLVVFLCVMFCCRRTREDAKWQVVAQSLFAPGGVRYPSWYRRRGT